MLDNLVKVGYDYSGSIMIVNVWDLDTKTEFSVACEDTEYNDFDMGLVDRRFTAQERRALLDKTLFNGDPEIKREYLWWCYENDFREGRVAVGMTVRVIKGRKWPIGLEGVVRKFEYWKDAYGRLRTTYCILDGGQKVDVNNVVPIAM